MTDRTSPLGVLSWRPRMTMRARLTLTYATLLTATGALMLGTVYVFMRYVPTYAILPSKLEDGTSLPGVKATPSPVSPTSRDTDTASALHLSSASDILNTLLIVSAVVLVVLAVIGAVIGWVVAGRVLRPLAAINSAAKLAATGALDHRIGMRGPGDEVHDLADTFDDMLEKLDSSFQAHRRFAANASHELRTPLAANQTMLEVALADREPDPEAGYPELRKVAERVYRTNRRNIETVDSLLTLAEIGARGVRRDNLDLARIAADALRDLHDELDASGVRAELGLRPAAAVGDPVLLHRAVANLLQNAVRHNAAGGSLQVRTGPAPDGGAEVRVANTGPVVPEGTVASLTEPFVRGTGRTGGQRHHGLGLAIVAAVAEVHDAALDIAANPGGGLTVTFALPARDVVRRDVVRRDVIKT
ncbi:HAMP domain-containing sensor histidine kinase [Streptomyces sp. CBMA29]|uniref:sensor histidine kinase n=1 Tax=Streptomyces sp. CBMA29 TaxID=1896314 RepID=UPI002948B862|nr:HAMP domain-containing sensor histidine kinase [Streptomyces sp. CBMA29]